MKITIETAIQTIAQKAMLAEDSADAMRFAQAVQNLANALFTVHSAEQASREPGSLTVGFTKKLIEG